MNDIKQMLMLILMWLWCVLTNRDMFPMTRQITGKAMMLDEIINYVQSLQRQVEVRMISSPSDITEFLLKNIRILLNLSIMVCFRNSSCR